MSENEHNKKQFVLYWYKNCIYAQRMKPFTIALTTEVDDILDYVNQEQDLELPTLPIKTLVDQKDFEKRVQALRKEYESNKPVGNFF